jgi:UDP-N-acetylmuramoyl-tripeptide--D-alanyl-D-alanine ligase
MSLKDVAFRVRTLQPAESRLVSQTTESGITIINDAYSANPVGVLSSLKVLGMHQTGKRLLITPGMVELGELQEEENRKLGVVATQYATDIILVGEKQTEPLKEGILSTDFPSENLHIFGTLSEATQWYQQHLRSGDTVLFLNDLPDTY